MSTKKVAIIVSRGGLDEIYPAYILANGARQSGIEAVLFFTFYGLNAITEDKVDHLHVNMAGNAASPVPTALMGLPGMEAVAAKLMTKRMEDLDIPGPREFIQILHDSGVKLYGCLLAMEMFGIQKEELMEQVEDVITVGDFYALADDAQVLFT